MKPQHLAQWTMWAVDDIGLKVQYKLAHDRYTPARAYTNQSRGIMHDTGRGTNCIYAAGPQVRTIIPVRYTTNNKIVLSTEPGRRHAEIIIVNL